MLRFPVERLTVVEPGSLLQVRALRCFRIAEKCFEISVFRRLGFRRQDEAASHEESQIWRPNQLRKLAEIGSSSCVGES